MMKRLLSVFLLLTILMALSPLVAAHPGNTDQYGGHWNHSTGEYHYHGAPNSSHSGGNSANSSSGQSWGDSDYYSSGNSGCDSDDVSEWIMIGVFGVPFCVFLFWALVIIPISDKISDLRSRKKKPPSTQEQDTPKSPQVKSPPPPSDKSDNFTAPSAPKEEPRVDIPRSPSPPRPHIRGSEERLPPSPPPAVKSEAKAPTPPAAPVRPIPPQASRKSLKDYPEIIGYNADYLTEAQATAYAEAVTSSRGKRAVTEFYHFDEPIIDERTKPYRVECGLFSANSLNYYETTLRSCTCPDHQTRHKICKHMIALAIRVDALSVDVEAVKKK